MELIGLLDFLLDPFNYLFWIFIITIIISSIIIVWRPFNVYIQFAYLNAKVEAIGNPYLTEKELNKLIESKNIIELKETINTNKDYDIIGEWSNEIHNSLDDNFIKTIKQSKNDSSKKMKEFFNIFYEKIDLYYIKLIIKNKFRNVSIDVFDSGKTNLKKTKKLMDEIIDSEIENIPEILIKYGFKENISNIFSPNEADFILLDNLMDQYIINKFKNLKVPSKCIIGKQDFVNRMTDIKNIKNILRAKNLGYNEKTCDKLFLGDGQEISLWKFKELSQNEDVYQIISNLEGTSYYNILKDSIEIFNQEKSTQIFENLLDESYLNNLKEISIQNYVHIGPILRFLISKEYEIMNLKIISKGIEEKINSDIIKKLIVKVNE